MLQQENLEQGRVRYRDGDPEVVQVPEIEPGAGETGKKEFVDFEITPAVNASRLRQRFINCAVCQADHSQYLFHKGGVRFVRCSACGMVYVNPIGASGQNYFDIDEMKQFADPQDRELCISDFEIFLGNLERKFMESEGKAPTRTLLIGRFLPEFATSETAKRMGLRLVEVNDAAFHKLAVDGQYGWLRKHLTQDTQLVVLHEVLEACADPHAFMEYLTKGLPEKTWFAVTYTNSESIPARVMRRVWSHYFSYKTVFFNTRNLTALFSRFGFLLKTQFPYPVTHTAGYVAGRLALDSRATQLIAESPLSKLTMPIRSGARAALFCAAKQPDTREEKLSIVFPCFNEARTVEQVLRKLLKKNLKIEREIIIVESNSTDGTREIVQKYADTPGVKLILEDRPRGKGHAVRTGLKAVTGSIVLIQDADFEYDIDDYDALLEPILHHRASFVLGSRTLGLDDWKVRRFAKGKAKGFVLNFAHVLFAQTYNLLYQQRITDINTMFKVFRSECLEGLDLQGDRFELDIELACKLAMNGNTPMEVPVNYVARDFADGKKIRFFRDSLPLYFALYKYRFGR